MPSLIAADRGRASKSTVLNGAMNTAKNIAITNYFLVRSDSLVLHETLPDFKWICS
jgi:hypothetical protein